MNAINGFIEQNQNIIIITLALLLVLSLLMSTILNIKLNRIKRWYKAIFKGSEVENIEDIILKMKEEVLLVKTAHRSIQEEIDQIFESMKKTYSKSAIHKYDAFNGLSGRLSFVYVLLNPLNNGIILNGIYSSEGHYLYIKDVVDGKTEKELSKEEKMTLEQAIQQKY